MAVPAVMNHRDPYLSDSRPATGAISRIITVNGNSRMPAWTGEKPRTFWRYSERKNVVPNSEKNTAAATTFDAANVGILKNDSGSIGYSRLDSITKNVTSSTAASTKAARMSPSVHPRSFPSMRP